MKVYLFAYSQNGKETALRVKAALNEAALLYAPQRLCGEGFLEIPTPSEPLYAQAFGGADALIFISSCGIAVRSVAPFIKSKTTDPAVIVIDEAAGFVIPLLSGHIGGANELAKKLAVSLGATAAVTTATDVRGRFSVDEWAAKRGYCISDMGRAKAVSAAILERDIPISSDFPIRGKLAPGLYLGKGGETGISVSYKTAEPFEKTLRIIPKCLILGVGCRRGTPKELIESAVEAVLEENEMDMRAVLSAASITLKADEAGLLEFCRESGIRIAFYTAEELRRVEGDFTPSEFVKSITGVDNVCERAAMLGSDRLLVKKTPVSGVTVAIGIKNTEIAFQ